MKISGGWVKKLATFSTSSVWAFPALLTIVLIILTGLRISGTSVGIYHQRLLGTSSQDSNLVYGQPQTIRSDEWLYNTQMTIAQHAAGYPRINRNILPQQDMSLVTDVPYKGWSTVFKPQNLAFLVSPLEYAFAFKWWLLLYLLIISCYFFSLRILKNKAAAILFAIAFGFSPFVFWWYQTITLAPLFYGFFLMILGMRIINKEPVRWLEDKKPIYSQVIYGVGVAYLLTALGMIFYLPFQIPVAIAVALFLVGYSLERKSIDKLDWRGLYRRLAPILVGIVLAGAIFGLFVATRYDTIKTIENTVYPGKRITYSGHFSPMYFFDGFLNTELQKAGPAAHFFTNQSEASNFMPLMPFLLIPGLALMTYEYKTRRRIDPVLAFIQLGCLIFLARLFIPGFQLPYRLLLLDRVPLDRLMIGVGFIGAIQSLYIISKLETLKLSRKLLNLPTATYSLACFVVLLWVGFWTRLIYPGFLPSSLKVIKLSLIFTAIIWLILVRRTLLALAILAVFSVASVAHIHPLYRGLGLLDSNQVTKVIDQVSPPNSRWAAVDTIEFENFPALANRGNLGGIHAYPNLDFWRQAVGAQDDFIYDRYAHVTFDSNPAFQPALSLVQKDQFQVKFACDSFIEKNLDYALSVLPLDSDSQCAKLIDTINYPGQTFYVYKISQQ